MFKQLPLFLLVITFFGYSQELPPIINYTSATYGAGNQDWMISQDKNNFLFFANNDGLLEFNGASWNLYNSPNETIIRSVKVINNLIYTGCYMEFGFWKRHTNGQLVYTSLSSKIKNQLIDDEQFWNILNYDQWVIFQSLSRIYIYDIETKKINIITPPKGVWKSFKTNNSFYFQTLGEGLFEIENGKSKLVCNNAILKNNKIVNIFTIDNQLLIATQQSGFYKFDGKALSKYSMIADSELNLNSIYCCQLLSNQSIAVGTISNGIYIITKEGAIQYHIVQNKGISNNTVLSIFEDIDKNIWLGLDNGINCINLQSPVTSFTDETGILGTVYTSILYQRKLFIGTNQGLFYKNYDTNEELKFIPGTKGQVWSLFEHDGSLFCGHDSGTFIIENTIAKSIFSQSGTWKFENVEGNSNLLLQGNYYGVSVLERKNNLWSFRNKISGFDYSSKHFEITKSNQIFVSHEYKGIFRFKVDDKFEKASELVTFKNPKAGKNACLTKYNNTIYYAYKKGIFKLNSATNEFKKDYLLSSIFEKDEYTSGKLIVDTSNKIWLFSKNYIHYFSLSKLNYDLKQNTIPIPASLTNSMLGYENITQISNSIYLIGTTNGYYIININDLSFKNYSISITNVNSNKVNEEIKNCSITEEGKFGYNENNITFNFTVPEYNKYINAEYQYKLEGMQDNWSEWSSKATINFKNLEPGDYVFKVRSKIGNSLPENTASYKFTIHKPWYSTNLAVLIYFLLFIISAYYINKAYRNYYSIQSEKLIEENNRLLEISALENEQQLMKLKNEQLSQDFDTKNRELAVSNMSLIKKNELLSIIKDDLKKSSEENNGRSLKSVISTINRNITQEDSSWNVFKEAFDSADKDFLNRVKGIHPSLTPNDLRLCAYLRLNLSSKEIAPLLNISVRSIEIKRYRLRKKMDLTHQQGLVEYILSV
jgi:ligand-binding sensor domain-containing protein/DNA-binding CsgD family transcriptional regulator